MVCYHRGLPRLISQWIQVKHGGVAAWNISQTTLSLSTPDKVVTIYKRKVTKYLELIMHLVMKCALHYTLFILNIIKKIVNLSFLAFCSSILLSLSAWFCLRKQTDITVKSKYNKKNTKLWPFHSKRNIWNPKYIMFFILLTHTKCTQCTQTLHVVWNLLSQYILNLH